jgi:hypothetical protein
MAASLSATVALVLLFLPKVYLIICHPEKNVRSFFKTSQGIRCHIGLSRDDDDGAEVSERLFVLLVSTRSVVLAVCGDRVDDVYFNSYIVTENCQTSVRQKIFSGNRVQKSMNKSRLCWEVPQGRHKYC